MRRLYYTWREESLQVGVREPCALRVGTSVSRVSGRAAAVFTCAEVTVLTCACVSQRAAYIENATRLCFLRGKWFYSLSN